MTRLRQQGRTSLMKRLFTANIVGAALSAIALTAFFLVSFRTEFKRQQLVRAQMLAQFVARQSMVSALVGDTNAMETIADNALGSEDVQSVRISCRGCLRDIVAIKGFKARPEAPGRSPSSGSWVEANEDMRANAVGLLDWEETSRKAPEIVGRVQLRLSRDKQEALFRRTSEQAFIVLCGVLFLTLTAQYCQIRNMLHPLAKLAAFTHRIGAGDLSGRTPVDDIDEIADVAVAFNEMLDRLSLTTVSRDYVDNIIRSMSECLIVVDHAGYIRTANDAALELLEYSRAELTGQPVSLIVGGETDDLMRNVASTELLWRTKEGRLLPVLFSSAALRTNPGSEAGLVWLAQDITERKRVREELIAARERYALAVAGANDGIWDWSITTSEIYYSPRWKSMLGYQDYDLPASLDSWTSLIHPEDRARVASEIEEHRTGATATLESEHRMQHADGRYRWMLCRGLGVRDSNGIATRMAGSQTDITQNKASDPLTGLPNRVLFTEHLVNAFDRRQRDPEYSFTVLFLDLDRFKMINDSLGHQAGDRLLLAIAGRLKARVAAEKGSVEATVARLSGDEFAVLIEGFTKNEAARAGSRLAERLLRDIAVPFFFDSREVFTSVSIGVAPAVEEYTTPAEILRDADTAMYRAKALGRSRCEVFDSEMRAQAILKLELDTELRIAVDRGEFEVFYQPKFSFTDRSLLGFEALVRWRHPQRGLIPPAQFIPAAEETGLILPIGELVLREACRQMHDWQTRYPAYRSLRLSVNLSARQFLEPDITTLIANVLSESGIAPCTLSLEVTESVLVGDHESVSIKLARLKELGIGLEIDDFGTGYSSLSYLHRFPFDIVKIDRSFVSNVENGEGAAMIQAIVSLARNLGMKVIAEGVETSEQMEILQVAGCETGQGFLFSRPVPASVAEAGLSSEIGFQSALAVLAEHVSAGAKEICFEAFAPRP